MTAELLSTIAVASDVVPSRYLSEVTPSASAGAHAVLSRLNDAGTAFCSLEMPLSSRGYPREKLVAFRSELNLAPDLVKMGFDVVSLANNHSMDHGESALIDTLETLHANGLQTVGAGTDLAEAESLAVREIDGLKIGFLAWTCLLPLGAAAGERRPGVAPLHIEVSYEVLAGAQQEEPGTPPSVRSWPNADEMRHVAEIIAAAKKSVDFLAVSAHIGYGSGEEMAEYERLVAHGIVDAGADIVLGNHVHTIHGIEVYGGKVIIYSQGNFVAQQPREGASALAIQILDEMSNEGFLSVVSLYDDASYTVECTPVVGGVDGLPAFVDNETGSVIAERIVQLSSQLDTAPHEVTDRFTRFRGTW